MAYETILVETQNAIARVTLNRPDTLNAMNQTMIGELTEVFTGLAGQTDVRAVVVTGAGRAFSSGGDIRGMLAAAPETAAEAVTAMIERVNGMVLALYNLPQPVIAAINGPAHGLGMSLTLAADYRIAAMSASFSQAFIRIGLVPDGGDVSPAARCRLGLRHGFDVDRTDGSGRRGQNHRFGTSDGR